jgi:hypothetical protein
MNKNKKKTKRKWLILASIVVVCGIITGVIVLHSVNNNSVKASDDTRLITGGSTDLSVVLQHVNETSDKIIGMKINSTLLALSGLKQPVDTVLQNQKSISDICSRISETSNRDFGNNSDLSRICSDLDANNTVLDENYEQMLKAKKNRDISQMKSLLEDVEKRQSTIINDLNVLEESI